MSAITYQQNGDYLIPNLTISQTERPIGKYGRMRRTFLQANRPMLFNSLVVTGKLFPHVPVEEPWILRRRVSGGAAIRTTAAI